MWVAVPVHWNTHPKLSPSFPISFFPPLFFPEVIFDRMSDLNELGGGFFVGSIESTLDQSHLHSIGITHIVAVGKEFTNDTERFRSFQLHVVPIHDGPHELLKNYIPNALIFMEKALNRSGKVLIFRYSTPNQHSSPSPSPSPSSSSRIHFCTMCTCCFVRDGQ
jgi:hypothetical protein